MCDNIQLYIPYLINFNSPYFLQQQYEIRLKICKTILDKQEAVEDNISTRNRYVAEKMLLNLCIVN